MDRPRLDLFSPAKTTLAPIFLFCAPAVHQYPSLLHQNGKMGVLLHIYIYYVCVYVGVVVVVVVAVVVVAFVVGGDGVVCC